MRVCFRRNNLVTWIYVDKSTFISINHEFSPAFSYLTIEKQAVVSTKRDLPQFVVGNVNKTRGQDGYQGQPKLIMQTCTSGLPSASQICSVRAHCYCESLVRTLFIGHARATSFSSARTDSKTQQNIERMTFALTWCANIFVGCSVTPTFFSADHFVF